MEGCGTHGATVVFMALKAMDTFALAPSDKYNLGKDSEYEWRWILIYDRIWELVRPDAF